ncbi:MAG TPA: DUF2924 domain-containing protein [Acidocella sp.]|nr:DUF2924 domain-containing protein [Acidocella sp.]
MNGCQKIRRPNAEVRLAKELASLPNLDRAQLKRRWRRLYGTEPAAKVSRVLLQYAVAYGLQAEAFGGLKPAVARMLEGSSHDKTTLASVPIRPGTKFLREWNGIVHEVEVLGEGVLYRGQRFRSLSAVAWRITGSHRSGPLFFGLRPTPGKNGAANGVDGTAPMASLVGQEP